MRGKVTLLAVVAAGIMLAAVSFSVYQQATAENAADPQLRASARLLLPQLSQDRIWSGRSYGKAVQAVLDRYASVLYTRKQFAFVCWSSPAWYMGDCKGTHGSSNFLPIQASHFDPDQLVKPQFGSVSFRGYATALVLPRSVRRWFYGHLYIFQAVD